MPTLRCVHDGDDGREGIETNLSACPRRAEGEAMTLDRDTLLEAAERIDALKVDKARCRVLMLTEQAWEEAQYQCSAELRALAAEQPENSQQVGIVQVLPLVPQPSTVTTVTPDPVAQEVKIKDASLSRTPETDAIDA